MAEQCPLTEIHDYSEKDKFGFIINENVPAECLRCMFIARNGEWGEDVARRHTQQTEELKNRELRPGELPPFKQVGIMIDVDSKRTSFQDSRGGRDTQTFACEGVGELAKQVPQLNFKDVFVVGKNATKNKNQ